jgi:electron transfer flavoprotein alpha subunit
MKKNNVFVYLEINDEGHIADVSLELCSKGRKLADQLGVDLEAVAIGDKISDNIKKDIVDFGVNTLYIAEDKRLSPYTTIPHSKILSKVLKDQNADVALIGATSIGRDLAPRVASTLKCGLTADCTSLEIGDHYVKKIDKTYKNLLYQIRPAFGGNIIATIINPDTKPQMATVREGVMKKDIVENPPKLKVNKIDLKEIISDEDFVIEVIERHIEKSKVNIKNSQIIIAGGYGLGSKENFDKLFDLADVIGGDVGGSRAAVDAGFCNHDRQIGQTGITVRPKLYIGFGISGAVQHRAGMDSSAQIISVNTDPNAPLNAIADYVINASAEDVIPKMIKYYKKNSK